MTSSRFLSIIRDNNLRLDSRNAQRILLIIDLKDYPIGDSVIAFSGLRALQSYLRHGAIDVYTAPGHYHLLKNNPFINTLFLNLQDIETGVYDQVIFYTYKEREYLRWLIGQCSTPGAGTVFKAAAFSLTNLAFSLTSRTVRPTDANIALPPYDGFIRYLSDEYPRERVVKGQELFLSEDEKAWGEAWLRGKGLKKDEALVVLLDSSSGSHKLLALPVFFEVLNYFRKFEKVKILIFDERNLGKKDFYLNWLGPEAAGDFIFAEGLNLRKAICLLGSDNTKVIFGPCTGLMHCASGVYNSLLHSRKPFKDVPLMITYLGADPTFNKWDWWRDSLADCLLVEKNAKGQNQISRLTGNNYESLTCKDFTTPLLINYLDKHYRNKLLLMGMRVRDAGSAFGNAVPVAVADRSATGISTIGWDAATVR